MSGENAGVAGAVGMAGEVGAAEVGVAEVGVAEVGVAGEALEPHEATGAVDDALATELSAEFARRHGSAPLGVWSAPGRVNLIGEHTDYNKGFVLPFAIDRRAYVALGSRDDGLARVSSTFTDEVVEVPLEKLSPELLEGWSAYPLGVAWALLAQEAPAGESGVAGVGEVGVAGIDAAAAHPAGSHPAGGESGSAGARGFSLHIHSDVPIGAGLSSSAAIECATAVALNEFWELGNTPKALARVGQIAENQVVGAPTGIMDQSASMLGRLDAAVFLDCRSMQTETVALGLAAHEYEILVIDTKVSHDHATGGYAARRASCERAAEVMQVDSLRELSPADLPRMRAALDDETFRRARHIVTENDRVEATVRLLETSGPQAIGALLDASHVSMRDDFEISVPQLDLAVEVAQSLGAVGARMTGGGFGGSALALVPRALRPALEAGILEAFAQHGYRAPDLFVVQPSDGATLKGQLR
ncbi:galactokinase [Subtercola lobariae]|uniref:Galactokinase n=1 Tax=Subtercola lobariae TaxID=1588641 RepID=A0A917B777_9MICO|nr:galactokinase [Subtercola lobariae]GGF29306.1 galactokinase [Subtercola lobariae]